MKPLSSLSKLVAGTAALIIAMPDASAQNYDVTVQGTDVIFLAGRTDVVIPASNLSWSLLGRHGGNTPEENAGQGLETFPSWIPVSGLDIVRVADPGVGGINFFNGFGPPYFGPDGNGTSGSSLTALGGISGYIGPQGPLTGVFLDNSIPNGSPPPTLDFSLPGSRDFLSLAPQIGQIFYIGNGLNSLSQYQQFVAPVGATRLFFGIPDGFGFGGAPGAYDDNDGSYRISVGVNQIPSTSVPDGGSTAALLLTATLGLIVARRRRS